MDPVAVRNEMERVRALSRPPKSQTDVAGPSGTQQAVPSGSQKAGPSVTQKAAGTTKRTTKGSGTEPPKKKSKTSLVEPSQSQPKKVTKKAKLTDAQIEGKHNTLYYAMQQGIHCIFLAISNQ